LEQKQPVAKIGVYEAIMLTLETSQPYPLHLELKPENKFTAYPEKVANNKLHGEWKTEGSLLHRQHRTHKTNDDPESRRNIVRLDFNG